MGFLENLGLGGNKRTKKPEKAKIRFAPYLEAAANNLEGHKVDMRIQTAKALQEFRKGIELPDPNELSMPDLSKAERDRRFDMMEEWVNKNMTPEEKQLEGVESTHTIFKKKLSNIVKCLGLKENITKPFTVFLGSQKVEIFYIPAANGHKEALKIDVTIPSGEMHFIDEGMDGEANAGIIIEKVKYFDGGEGRQIQSWNWDQIPEFDPSINVSTMSSKYRILGTYNFDIINQIAVAMEPEAWQTEPTTPPSTE